MSGCTSFRHSPPTQPAGTWHLSLKTVEAALLDRYFHVWQGTETGSFFVLFIVEMSKEQSVILDLSFCLKMCLEQQKTWKQQLPIHHLLPRLNRCWLPHDLQRFLRKWKPLMTSKAHCGCERHLECFGKAFNMTMLAKPLWYVPVSLTRGYFENYLQRVWGKVPGNLQTFGRLQFCCSHFPRR